MPALAGLSGIVVVRHAEKTDNGRQDPELTAAGHARAEALARVLGQTKVVGLIATQYRRTQQTLATLAREHGLEITVVPAQTEATGAHIETIISQVRQWDQHPGGVLVIAGHSNTVPLIVEALSGRTVPSIDESEYDHLFVLLPGNEGMEVITTGYGEKSAPGENNQSISPGKVGDI